MMSIIKFTLKHNKTSIIKIILAKNILISLLQQLEHIIKNMHTCYSKHI